MLKSTQPGKCFAHSTSKTCWQQREEAKKTKQQIPKLISDQFNFSPSPFFIRFNPRFFWIACCTPFNWCCCQRRRVITICCSSGSPAKYTQLKEFICNLYLGFEYSIITTIYVYEELLQGGKTFIFYLASSMFEKNVSFCFFLFIFLSTM